MILAFYVNLADKTLHGSGLGATCRPVSRDGTVTVMAKDPDVQVNYFVECGMSTYLQLHMSIKECSCI